MPLKPLRLLTEADVRTLFTVELAVESQRDAFRALGNEEAVLPARLLVEGADGNVAFCYAARTHRHSAAVSKFGAVHDSNPSRGLPAVNAVIVVLDEQTGMPAALIEGTSITELRTAAASAVAAEALAPHARSLAVLGAGVQAAAHVRAIASTHDLDRVRISAPNAHRAESIASALTEELALPVDAVNSAQQAVGGAEIVALCTTSAQPVLQADWLDPGTTVISVGAFAPDRHEYGQDLLASADRIVVDDRLAALGQSAPLVRAAAEGAIDPAQIDTLGEVLVGRAPGRSSPAQLVVYTSVGIGLQDAAAASRLLSRAHDADVGQVISLAG
ncbi:ornithine cyclodeaminase family protein [uncultured Aeromicrobium sp.]|uniref:ornithine cyclodeaminase family protein n=1 Tax=uncultured Aeromicrobium sp. TaxID=337820 RepID=UPI0025E2EA24|nr:ornithine cyclodeaminase family protein [uncultured Aeromicrobium sp.]